MDGGRGRYEDSVLACYSDQNRIKNMFISTRRFPNRLVRVRLAIELHLHLSQNEMAAEAAFKDVPEIFEVIIP